MKLNSKQLEAVNHPSGPLLILAGAGSGKTRVIVQRVAHFVQNEGIPPHRILAVTFTNKAADEMKERLRTLLPNGAQGLWVSTFHSTCLRILRQHAGELGWQKDFVVYDDNDHMSLIKTCLKELNLDIKAMHPRAVSSRIDSAKNLLITPEKFDEDAKDVFERKVAEVYTLYQKHLKANNAMDFGDLIFKTVELFKSSPRVLDYFQSLFQAVLVDEYQDTNHSQYELIRLLAEKHKNLCVVGDDDQSIYRWRGADVNNILEFEKDYPGAKVIKLEQNYRSTPEILSLASSVIKNNGGRKGKTLWTDNPGGEKAILMSASDEKEEARHVASEIKKLESEGVKYSNCAIFYRTNAQSRLFEEEFNRQKMPYVIFGGMRFYERMEIKDILAYVRVIVNPKDSVNLRRIINVPTRGIGKKLISSLEDYAKQTGSSLLEACSRANEINALSRSAQEKAMSFYKLIQYFQGKPQHTDLAQTLRELMDKTGYKKELEKQKTPESESRLENLDELLNVMDDFESDEEEASFPIFLDHIALVGATDNFDPEKGAISLMTMHLAKGLEFPAIFMVGLEEGIFPHQRSMENEDELEEERRLCYVGLTRAQKKIHLSHALKRRLYGGEQFNLPSRFLDEMPSELVNKLEAQATKRASTVDTFFDDDFDQRPMQEKLVQSIEKAVASKFKIGLTVRHPIFGSGIVKGRQGLKEQEKVTVYFQNGKVKTLMTKYANLKIM